MPKSKYYKNTLKKVLDCQKNKNNDLKIFLNEVDWYNLFRENVKTTKYADYVEDFEYDFNNGISQLSNKKTVFFATSSSNFDKAKIIPYSTLSLRNYVNSSFGLFKHLLRNLKYDEILGKVLLITGKSRDSYSPKNVPVGSISGKIASQIFKYAAPFFTYSPDHVNCLSPIERYRYILNSFKPDKLTGIVGTNPFIVHKMLSDKISCNPIYNNELIFNNLYKHYPKLKFIICLTGNPMRWHADQLKRAFDNKIKIFDPGIGASEGLFTSGCLSFDSIGTPIVNNGSQFIEYLPIDSPPKYANFHPNDFLGCKVEPLLTNDSGLVRYKIEDVYKVICDNGMYMLEFLGKKEKVFSFATERVFESNIYELMKRYSQSSNTDIVDYAFYYENVSGSLGRYVFIISINDFRLKNQINEIQPNSLLFDSLLQDINPEYKNSRLNNTILPAEIRVNNDLIRKIRTPKFGLNRQEKELIFLTNDIYVK